MMEFIIQGMMHCLLGFKEMFFRMCVAHLKKNVLIDIEKNDLYGLYQKHLIKFNERLIIITKIKDLLGQIISSLYCHTYAQCVSRSKTSIHILKFKMQTHSLAAL